MLFVLGHYLFLEAHSFCRSQKLFTCWNKLIYADKFESIVLFPVVTIVYLYMYMYM